MALLPVDHALARILAGARPVSHKDVPLAQALGRVLAKPVVAKRDQPPFPSSAMDGYALRHEDLAKGTVAFALVGTSAAGHGFAGAVKTGQAVRISTGAPLPEGADTVVIQENCTVDGASLVVRQSPPPGKNIRRRGLDFVRGDLLLDANVRLRPRDLGLAAAGNAATLKVRRRIRVAILTTGDELVLPGGAARADQIYSSNSHAIAAMAEAWGAEVINLGIVKDTLKATVAAVRKGMTADILLTTGGASVGDHDHVQAAFKACGIKISFWKIALRPGKPFMHGRKGKLHVMGLPGNPVSALITARLFLKPLLEAMNGLPPDEPSQFATLTTAMPPNDERQDYVRATLAVSETGARSVAPFNLQDSSMQRVLQLSQALIIRPPLAPAAAVGAQVPVLLMDF
jgi:molybdopterin molybdotransferase